MQHTDQTTQPLTGTLVPAPTPAAPRIDDGGVWTALPQHHMDLDTALTLLTPAEVDRIVTQASQSISVPQVSLTPTPVPGTIEAYLPGCPHPVYVHPAQPQQHTPPPVVMRNAVVDKWAVNTAVVSLSLSTAALIGSYALEQAAIAAATVVATLASMGWFLLALAIVLGVISVAKKKAGVPHVHIDQTVNQKFDVHGGGFLGRATVETSSGIVNTVKR
ncbi:hypothetical protein [Streptomyces pseudogriseolus]|uniref:hypothetical protein n=1 Tax=Streptomyces pseudogriseolus TaxID=36817 RepID=UPI003FA1C6FB